MEVGQGLAVRDHLEVKAVLVTARPPGTKGLGYQMKGRSPRTTGLVNDTSRLKLGKVRLSLMRTVLVQAASLGKGRGTSGGNVTLNAMGGMRRRKISEEKTVG